MYPKNAASPEPIAIGAVLLTADGTVQTSGVTVRIKPIGVAEADGVGTVAYSTDGVIIYTPTQAETNYTSFVLVAKKASCIPASITVITTASATPGTVLLAPVTHTNAVVPRVTLVDTTTTNTDMRGTDSALLASNYTAPANSDIGLIKVITDRLGAMLVLDGSVYQYTANALELAPAGGGGSDPLESAVPGAYAAGTAGYIIGTFVDSKLSTIQQGVNAIGNAGSGVAF